MVGCSSSMTLVICKTGRTRHLECFNWWGLSCIGCPQKSAFTFNLEVSIIENFYPLGKCCCVACKIRKHMLCFCLMQIALLLLLNTAKYEAGSFLVHLDRVESGFTRQIFGSFGFTAERLCPKTLPSASVYAKRILQLQLCRHLGTCGLP